MRKRILSLIMVLVMIFGMMPVSVLAVDTPYNSGYMSIAANVEGEVTFSMDTVANNTEGVYENASIYPCIVTVPVGTTEVYVTVESTDFVDWSLDTEITDTDDETYCIGHNKIAGFQYDIT